MDEVLELLARAEEAPELISRLLEQVSRCSECYQAADSALDRLRREGEVLLDDIRDLMRDQDS